ncbi:FkbM family methyltransferase [Metabacillus halosaccharovorans]|uniref:FkbM family methyltransferase n=1 Tax=Metabacillus halosaccharovorans TaxID=930124 RepID=A0ABT3DC95_9BACI|nr:FkbM family methyltransferase [Metabacillus halosaccharovorans]MCV9884670.1 FkbM family methyltransferase [Metabacillus halosaccharovorans]
MFVIEDLLEKFNSGKLIASDSRLEKIETKQIVLFGAGGIGKELYMVLMDKGINVFCFLDTVYCPDHNDEEIIKIGNYKVPVYNPNSKKLENLKTEGYVILSALFPHDIRNQVKGQLLKIGYKNVFALQEVNFSNLDSFYKLFHISNNYEKLIQTDKEKIIKTYNLLESRQDKDLYIEHIKAHLTKDFSEKKEPLGINLQYLAHDIPVEKDYSHFIDCGGFDGDTIKNFVSNGVSLNNIVIFEPQNDLNKKIKEFVTKNREKFNSVTIFPCGVNSTTAKFKFSTSTTVPASSVIDESGSDIIQCVAIDEVLFGFKPTFIKMDIEGAEVEALKGAKETIIQYKPQLAISVYHSLSDLWEIPLLIKSFYSGYKFYLRNYNSMGLETVLYAFPEK